MDELFCRFLHHSNGLSIYFYSINDESSSRPLILVTFSVHKIRPRVGEILFETKSTLQSIPLILKRSTGKWSNPITSVCSDPIRSNKGELIGFDQIWKRPWRSWDPIKSNQIELHLFRHNSSLYTWSENESAQLFQSCLKKIELWTDDSLQEVLFFSQLFWPIKNGFCSPTHKKLRSWIYLSRY